MSGDAQGRDGFAAYRELLAAYGFKPSRRLGQNFLLDPSLHRVLVRAVDPRPGDLVLEVGPGLGFLTRELAGRARVVAVEVDRRLVEVLRREIPRFADGGASVRLLHADVLERGALNPAVVAALAEERAAHRGRLLVVANLPYAVAGPLLAELACLDDPPDELGVLVQAELAGRVAAAPGTREYGALTAQLQLAYEPAILRRVGAQVFRPRPRVDSAMLHLRRRPGGTLERPVAERQALAGFLRDVFGSRRKKLRNARGLGGVVLPPELAGLLEARPDQVAPPELLALHRAVAGTGEKTP